MISIFPKKSTHRVQMNGWCQKKLTLASLLKTKIVKTDPPAPACQGLQGCVMRLNCFFNHTSVFTCSGWNGDPQRWQTLPSHTPTQLRLARSLARTTRTRNETETDFPIRGLLRRLIPLDLRFQHIPICLVLNFWSKSKLSIGIQFFHQAS